MLKFQEDTHPRTLIVTDLEHCVDCNRCIRVCPVETASLIHLGKDGSIKVRVDSTQCIACGACVAACEHGARQYEDDCNAFLTELNNGAPLNLTVAPSVPTHIPEWERLFALLRTFGVRLICAVSVGADICVWAHVRYMERKPSCRLITHSPARPLWPIASVRGTNCWRVCRPSTAPCCAPPSICAITRMSTAPLPPCRPVLPRPTNSRQQALSATTSPFRD